MPLLFPNFRVTQVFGANTNVGKTLLTTALLRATASRYAERSKGKGKETVFYLKPVSTGPDDESDTSYVIRNAGRHAERIKTHCLYQYREPMSPHLAAQLAPDLPFPKDNEALVRGVEQHVRDSLASLGGARGSMFVETAGGVHSPSLHPPHTQSTSLRPLLLPSILIASPHLGGISATLASYESLLLRGYDLSAVLCLHHPYYRNDSFLAPYFEERGVPYWTIQAPPERAPSREEDGERLERWYTSVEGMGSVPGEQGGGGVKDVVESLERQHDERIQRLEGMAERTLGSVWWPFTQHGLVNKKEEVMVIDSAHGDTFDSFYTKSAGAKDLQKHKADESLLKSYFDGSASWFTQSHGHASEPLTLAAARAAGRYGHVLFPSGTHAPALDLAEKLIATVGKGWAERVFYSDNGSTAIEVALKMALRASGRRYGWDGEVGGDVGVIGLRGGYHGDTIGAMDASEKSTFNTVVDWYRGRGHWFSPPQVLLKDGIPTVNSTPPDAWPTLPSDLGSTSSSSSASSTDPSSWQISYPSLSAIYDLPTRLRSDPLAKYYRDHIRSTLERLTREEGKQFGALVMEPTCLGAGGMVFVDPLFQACLVEVVRASADLFGGEGEYTEELTDFGMRRENGDWKGLPVIYDEVFSGLHRFGYHTASTVLTHSPDISAYAKILTGGLLPLSATLASSSIFNAFVSKHKVDALLHGHSYTAHPVGCAVALKAIELVEEHERKGGWDGEKGMWRQGDAEDVPTMGRWSFWSPEFLEAVSRTKGVKGAMGMGTVFAVELDDAEGGYSSHAALEWLTALRQEVITSSTQDFSPFQIHSRPLGNVCYFITSLFTKPEVMRAMEQVILRRLTDTEV